MNMEKRIVKLGEEMMGDLYKKSIPSITWAQVKKKYGNTTIAPHSKHGIFKYESEAILDKYKKKCKNKFEEDSLNWFWLDHAPKTIPTPGSDEAIKQKCICAVLDNCRGSEEFGKIHGFWITKGCPLHWPVKEVES